MLARWGEPVKDFVKAVKAHAKLRGLGRYVNRYTPGEEFVFDEGESYWVCLARIVRQRKVPWTLAYLRSAPNSPSTV